jgi:hypothetical protein
MMTLMLVYDFAHEALSPFEGLTHVKSIFKIMSINAVVASLILSHNNSSFMLL